MSGTRAIALSELDDGKPTRVDVDGVPICLVRVGEAVKALHDTCSHQEWSLARGLIWDNAVECDLHGSCFDLDTGQPTALPATKAAPTYAVTITDDEVFVDVTTPTNGAEVPEH